MTLKFEEWLSKCATKAMSSEWCIDPDWPRWFELYNEGLSYDQAVDELFKEVRKANAPNVPDQRPGESPKAL